LTLAPTNPDTGLAQLNLSGNDVRFLLACVLVVLTGVAKADALDLGPIDSHLAMWDRFAQGDRSLVPKMNETWPRARTALVEALKAKDPRAPSRLVFLMLVQVGGSVPVDSEMGQTWRNHVPDFPAHEVDSEKVYFAADFYAWWKRNESPQHDLPLLREWLSRDFARTHVIPMYERLQHQNSSVATP
jgi:hypothetical protein